MEPAPEARSNTDYWERYYATADRTARPLPSQFAVFVAGELPAPHRIVEFGCGTGRDSLFFAAYGHRVTAVDGSAAALKRAAELADELGEQLDFVHAAVDDPGLADRLSAADLPTLVYARFFLHAITDAEERSFLDLAAKLTGPGDLMAVEYRTIRDARGIKETDAHFRRFLNPADFHFAAVQHGFRVRYAVEGYGFAKYRDDDAYVARSIVERI